MTSNTLQFFFFVCLFAVTNLVQRSSHSRLSYESQCSRGTPTLKHAWALLSTVGTVWADDVILVNGPAIRGSASLWNEKTVGRDIMCSSRGVITAGKVVAAFWWVFFFLPLLLLLLLLLQKGQWRALETVCPQTLVSNYMLHVSKYWGMVGGFHVALLTSFDKWFLSLPVKAVVFSPGVVT